jgi:hypothetical protein
LELSVAVAHDRDASPAHPRPLKPSAKGPAHARLDLPCSGLRQVTAPGKRVAVSR